MAGSTFTAQHLDNCLAELMAAKGSCPGSGANTAIPAAVPVVCSRLIFQRVNPVEQEDQSFFDSRLFVSVCPCLSVSVCLSVCLSDCVCVLCDVCDVHGVCGVYGWRVCVACGVCVSCL